MLIKQHHSIKIKYMNKQSAALQYFSEGRVWDTRMIRSWVFRRVWSWWVNRQGNQKNYYIYFGIWYIFYPLQVIVKACTNNYKGLLWKMIVAEKFSLNSLTSFFQSEKRSWSYAFFFFRTISSNIKRWWYHINATVSLFSKSKKHYYTNFGNGGN